MDENLITWVILGGIGYLLLTSSTNGTNTLAALLSKASSSSGGKSSGSSGGGGNSGSGSSLGQGNSTPETLAQYIQNLEGPQTPLQTDNSETGLDTSIPLQTVTDGSSPLIFDVSGAIDQALGIATDPTSLSTTSDATDLSDTYIGAATDDGGGGGDGADGPYSVVGGDDGGDYGDEE